MKSKVILIGNYPSPISGQAVVSISGQAIAFKTMVDGFDPDSFYHVNTREKQESVKTINRVIDYFFVIFKFLLLILTKRVNTVYHIISSSERGFIRDKIIIDITRSLKKRIVIHSHNGDYNVFYNRQNKFVQKIIYKTINKVDKIILLSKKLSETFFFIEDKSKFIYIPNGLPINRITHKHDQKKNIVNILYLSNLIESKGYLDLLDSILLLKKNEKINKYHFHFAGGFLLNAHQDKSFTSIKEAKQLFFSTVEKNKLANYITYHGIVEGEIKEELLVKADIFILPTYYNIEAQPLTIIEAMAYGCAIYSTKYRGIPEMLFAGINGEYIEAKNPEDIASKISNSNFDKITKYGDQSIHIYKKHFTKEKYIARMKKILFLSNDNSS